MHDGVGAIVDCLGGLLDEDNLLYKGFKLFSYAFHNCFVSPYGLHVYFQLVGH